MSDALSRLPDTTPLALPMPTDLLLPENAFYEKSFYSIRVRFPNGYSGYADRQGLTGSENPSRATYRFFALGQYGLGKRTPIGEYPGLYVLNEQLQFEAWPPVPA